jgi:hypothetical protein
MSVVNVKVANIRPLGFTNLREWISDSQNEYIGRKGIVFIDGQRFPKQDSMWANPFKVGRDGTREEVIQKYGLYIQEKLKDPEYKDAIETLRGKKLGCWCKPEGCHGDVLLEFIYLINEEQGLQLHR